MPQTVFLLWNILSKLTRFIWLTTICKTYFLRWNTHSLSDDFRWNEHILSLALPGARKSGLLSSAYYLASMPLIFVESVYVWNISIGEIPFQFSMSKSCTWSCSWKFLYRYSFIDSKYILNLNTAQPSTHWMSWRRRSCNKISNIVNNIFRSTLIGNS